MRRPRAYRREGGGFVVLWGGYGLTVGREYVRPRFEVYWTRRAGRQWWAAALGVALWTDPGAVSVEERGAW